MIRNELLSIMTACILSVLMIVPISNAYGHGLGLDTIKSVDVNGKKITITTEIIPMDFTENKEKKIIIRSIDSQTNQNTNNTTLLIGLYHEGKMIFRNYFFAADGIINIKVSPTTNGSTTITGEKDNLLGAWYETDSKPIELTGPVFSSGGLYHFEIEIRTIDKPTNIVENLGIQVTDITIPTNQKFNEKTEDGEDVMFGIKSYYDKISNFDYDSNSNIVSFEMPFDWSEQNILHVPVVHEEVHFPKKFSNFFVPSYTGKVNGIDLFKSSITIDDYSDENERIIHFILSQDNLKFLKQVQQKAGVDKLENMKFTLEASYNVVFPMVAMTKNEEIQVDLSWDPTIIEPGKDTKFIFTFRNAKTGETLRNTSYDFIIIQNEKQIYEKSGNARVGGDYADYKFSEGQSGHTQIRFEKLKGTDMSTEFGLMVVPEFGSIVFVIFTIAMSSILIIRRNSSVFRI
ncbi:PEFG-CTERM sorting domain-containing protein [Candidatus Nitrosotenuis chungbukensis]|uniref:PEFG-CTERM sorting domain-containing protein n=2 Tax=Candidatus Nitrosotenuis chungbukensis TaxID=1353246 RepID=UPI0009772D47|nr:PEFG-CTERM sorting domain-containing protein [Candidatus Nitrosotenuis chungbukensis]